MHTYRQKRKFNPAQFLVIAYLAVISVGTLLLLLPVATTGEGSLTFMDALFTASSATCVTGLMVVEFGRAFTVFGQIIIMVLLQIGGIGIMTFSTIIALLLGRKIGLKERLLLKDDLDNIKMAGLVKLVKHVIFLTFTIEGLAAIPLFISFIKDYPVGEALYLAIFHSISAFNSAGFALSENSLTAPLASLIIMVLVILGSLGFSVLVELFSRKRMREFSLQSKIVLTFTLILIVFALFAFLLLEYNNPSTIGSLAPLQKLQTALFYSINSRSAGFNVLATGQMHSATLFLTIILMFIGASPGSTGGGIKTTTFGVIILAVWNVIRGKRDIEIFRRRLSERLVIKAFVITLLALFWVIFVTMLLSITESASFFALLFETVAAFGTVGLSTGITASLSGIGRLLIIFTMFIGRVGPLTLAVALAEQKQVLLYRYPEEEIMVG
ncbi:MAG: Trk family potassium uptake protein [Halanaerobiaceae bacterium]|nr:Trk family potassium uptake protein [Halanaerobiaceae bacterium]